MGAMASRNWPRTWPTDEWVPSSRSRCRVSRAPRQTGIVFWRSPACAPKAEQSYLAALPAAYAGRKVKVVGVDVKESEADYRAYLGRVPMPFPILKDESGDVSRSFAPDKALLSYRDRTEVVVSSNLVLDPTGAIRLFGLVDTANFDAELENVRRTVDVLLAAAPQP